MPRQVRILREADVRAALDMAACIEACDVAFARYSTGLASTPSVISLNISEQDATVHVKAGYVSEQPYFAIKVASGFPRNLALGIPANGGLVLAFDARTGEPAAFLLDNGYITDLRTGAGGGVAARHLARKDIRTVAVIGTGTQARYQLDALAEVRPGFTEVRVWGRDAERTAGCAAELRRRGLLPDGCTVTVTEDVRAAVDGADVVITCTASTQPLVRAEWLAPGVHVTAVGSDDVGKQELDATVLAAADLVVVDSRAQCALFGELQHAVGAGLMRAEDAVELGEVCAGSHPGRTTDEQLTVCDLTGVGVQDVAAANVVMTGAANRGDTLGI
jgi:ornithine cyclodeaminase